ncbi:MAG: indolepyruvate oxidoreductase subunit beta [Dehalococcoidales bacterium]|nr:indolepyruvate oxidoreductase subunit beta [Dehalococcoidales bacterium]
MTTLKNDPMNLIITGVGGQGNVLISWLIGETLLEHNYQVTVGETYGVSQRGGPVASHVRISKNKSYSAITPEGHANIILGLEPMESLRILSIFGNENTYVITNSRPVYPMAVAMGEIKYPDLDKIKHSIKMLSKKLWYLDASQKAIDLGVPLITNMIMVGALIGTGLLPLNLKQFKKRLEMSFSGEKLALNLKALDLGYSGIK